MGRALISFQFDGDPPVLADIASKAEHLSSMAILATGDFLNAVTTANHVDVWSPLRLSEVAFTQFPDNTVWLRADNMPGEVLLVHDVFTSSPALVRLMCHTLVALGGRMDGVPECLPLPIAPAQVEQMMHTRKAETRWFFLRIRIFLLSVAVAGLAAIGLLIGLFWHLLT